MPIKNYLSHEEQHLWKYIKDNEIINTETLCNIFPEMGGAKRNKLLHNLSVKGYIKRARKNLYFNPNKLSNVITLALQIKEGYLGLSSALRYYNLLDYEDFTIFIMTKNYQKKIDLKGTQYAIHFIPMKALFCGFEKKENMYISSLEKTFFDCFSKPALVSFSTITKALYDAKEINWRTFIHFFSIKKNSALCQRTGYIIEKLVETTTMKIPQFVFATLLRSVHHPVKLTSFRTSSKFNKKWKIQDNSDVKSSLSWWYDQNEV